MLGRLAVRGWLLSASRAALASLSELRGARTVSRRQYLVALLQ